MATVEHVLQVPKESKEVVDFAVGLLRNLLAGSGLAAVTAALPQAYKAVEGYDQLDDEFKSAGRSALAAYLVSELLDTLAPPETPAE